ncbi:hypothetical protein RhiirA5_505508 [Rhizophagus irregularis]|uniref:HTH myb-type domain-containing protein n=1 Tax=Rhizophagus irregularis TaxID=588596 RepID=A0A2I1F5V3_9GLOM|nr:hypothetical protein RhiirA5_505508 [Rhizophagus irregularis]PKC64912.1 hypothetical protein RhiirA1_536726 [Rhizophagus irregularis]PKY29756.1 hypothetical protein RhiirB3_474552 [Rhizophagus irregularis]CAB4485627.1 unnamed protein product [Rhizophagus irregularis]CAB5389350.1 unnamed protein product [Rhizophagus irregularis]
MLSPQDRYTVLLQLKRLRRIGNVRDPFVRISRILNNRYTASQISNYYRNYLNPELNLDDLNDDEEYFIDDWILCNRTENGTIRWTSLIKDLRKRYGFLRSENMIKNYWYTKQKRSRNSSQRRRRLSTSSRSSRRSSTFTIASTVIPVTTITLPFDPTALLTPPHHDDYTYHQQHNYLLPTLQCNFYPKEDKFPFKKFL